MTGQIRRLQHASYLPRFVTVVGLPRAGFALPLGLFTSLFTSSARLFPFLFYISVRRHLRFLPQRAYHWPLDGHATLILAGTP